MSTMTVLRLLRFRYLLTRQIGARREPTKRVYGRPMARPPLLRRLTKYAPPRSRHHIPMLQSSALHPHISRQLSGDRSRWNHKSCTTTTMEHGLKQLTNSGITNIYSSQSKQLYQMEPKMALRRRSITPTDFSEFLPKKTSTIGVNLQSRDRR